MEILVVARYGINLLIWHFLDWVDSRSRLLVQLAYFNDLVGLCSSLLIAMLSDSRRFRPLLLPLVSQEILTQKLFDIFVCPTIVSSTLSKVSSSHWPWLGLNHWLVQSCCF